MKLFPVITFLLFATTFVAIPSFVQGQKLRTIAPKSAQKMHQLFKYEKEDLPIISGHRGGIGVGFPENSIETMENTLKYTPAFFEIDPRLTKDSVIVLMHDVTLDRTTNGTGKLSDYTWEELQQLRLKDHTGKITECRIPTLEDAVLWARGKTILNLDNKDVPYKMIANIIKKHKANNFVMMTVHSPEHAQFYLDRDSKSTFSAHIKTPKEFEDYKRAGIPWSQMIAYIGSENKPENKIMVDLLHAVDVKVMISTAPTYDKLSSKEERVKAYQDFMSQGPDIIESDLPIEVEEALMTLQHSK